MSQVEIEYCVPCGLLARAEEVAHALLSALGRRVDALVVKPGHGGVFRVRVDGDVLFDKNSDGYELAEIVARVEERIGAPSERIAASQRGR